MLPAREIFFHYGWIALPLVAAIALLVFWRRRQAKIAKIADRRERHARNVAHQRAWDWLMGRSRHLRLTHIQDDDQPA
ncbi:hypothetical protein [Sphingomonas sp. LT1P40]|uniref:hypothetical protein n=1 Tax=Alteristakelama amylovorans TaxID=3096166 RepID=UPI002FCC2C2E